MRTITKRVHVESQFIHHDREQWDQCDLDYIADKVINKFGGHNPIVAVNYIHSGGFFTRQFDIVYIRKDSTATRSDNLKIVKEQLIMECV